MRLYMFASQRFIYIYFYKSICIKKFIRLHMCKKLNEILNIVFLYALFIFIFEHYQFILKHFFFENLFILVLNIK